MTTRNKRSLRSLTAFVVTWAFVVLTVTGLVLYIVPHGRVAHWVHWSLLGLGKDQWAWVHMMFGGLFILSGALHLYYNWKPFKQYLLDRVPGHFLLKPEAVAATLLTIAVFGLSAANLPPASWVIDLNDRIKASWVTTPELEPPFGHAEQVSLAGITRRMELDLDAGLAALRERGIAFDSPSETLDAVAKRNGMTPMAVYSVLRKHPAAMPTRAAPRTPADIEARYAGTGLGRKTLAEVCTESNLDLKACLERLADAGIRAESGVRLKALAEAHGRTPIELLTILLLSGQ
jgi:hypothetical protein